MLELTGMHKLVEQMKTQMLTGLKGQMKDVPDSMWVRFEQKLDMNQLLEKIVPLYDKYYSLEDLRAVNAFYSSGVGQRVLATLPKITQESMAIGMEWGKRIGEEAVQEAEAERRRRQRTTEKKPIQF